MLSSKNDTIQEHFVKGDALFSVELYPYTWEQECLVLLVAVRTSSHLSQLDEVLDYLYYTRLRTIVILRGVANSPARLYQQI